MKYSKMKRAVAVLSAVVMGVVTLGNISMTVKADTTTDEQVKARNEAYRTLLESELSYENRLSVKFNLVDIDNDGSEDLIITKTLAGDSNGYDMTSTEVYSWQNEQVGNESCGTGEHNKLFYSAGTDGNVYLMSEDYTPATGNKTGVAMYDYQIWKAFTLYGSGSEYGIGGENYRAFVMNESKDTYIKVNGTDWTVSDCDETEVIQYKNWLSTYMPNQIEIKGIYEATEENLDKYLPLTADVTIESATTKKITLYVGEAFGLSTENIDKLLAEAGYDFASTTPTIYHSDRVVIDTQYMVLASGVGVCEADTGTTIEMLYVTDEEFPALLEKYQNGTLKEQYGKEVWLVEEAEGFAYYVRAEKSGETTITIPEYKIGDTTITVNIPVSIQVKEVSANPDTNGDNNTGNVTDSANTGTTGNNITSTTDNSVVIDNSNGVLPTGTILQSAKLESGEVYSNAEKILKNCVTNLVNYAVYELKLTDGNGVEIHQLNGKVSVTMNIPFTMSENTALKVYRVDDGKLVLCSSTISNGKVTFETDHFSTYIFAEQQLSTTAPKTGDTTATLVYVMFMFAGISLCGVAIFWKKSRTE